MQNDVINYTLYDGMAKILTYTKFWLTSIRNYTMHKNWDSSIVLSFTLLIISHALLSPPPPYKIMSASSISQNINCKEGYTYFKGQPAMGVNGQLPAQVVSRL